MTALLAVACVVLMVQSVVLMCNLYHWRRRGEAPQPGSVHLSVLIPARNERETLPDLLSLLAVQTLRAAQILVCDDASEDGTDAWLEANAAGYGAEWFRAPQKPEGWVGKCWACHQLGLGAKADWLLFLDADVLPSPEFLARMAAWMAQTDAFMVTALPTFVATSIGDGLLTAMVPFSVFTLLPLSRSERARREAFAFANGQVIGFRREDYHRCRPHEQVRDAILEDVALARWVKRLGESVLILDATGHLRVSMYRGAAAAIQGFSRNAALICGGNVGALFVSLLMTIAYILPWAIAFTGCPWAWQVAAWGAILYGACAARFGFGIGYGLLAPGAAVLTVVTLLRSVVWRVRGTIFWKERTYTP
jgi:chlorobactene glucosyltransferase